MDSSLFSLLPDVLCLRTETEGVGAHLCETGRGIDLNELCSLSNIHFPYIP